MISLPSIPLFPAVDRPSGVSPLYLAPVGLLQKLKEVIPLRSPQSQFLGVVYLPCDHRSLYLGGLFRVSLPPSSPWLLSYLQGLSFHLLPEQVAD